MGSVTIRDVRKAYGGLTVLHGVSVDIADGEFVVLVGPSGCGKSTLLRMVAGLEEITGGDMLIDDAVINDMPPKNRDIAMVFQSYALYPHMTVAENMGFALRLNGTPKAEIQRRVEDAARILSLEPYLDRLPRNLSGGQRQRVAMGRAIVRKPKVFLFDEPLSNLDAKLRVQMRSEIKQNHARLRTTTIYVTHDQVEAMTMADRIVVMNGGRIEQVGTPLELYDRPRNLFVAGFIGSPSMNFITGTLADNRLTAADGTTIALAGLSTGNSLSGPVTIGVRPEHFVVDPAGTEATVLTVEPTGSETQVLLRLAGQDIMVSFRDRVDAAPGSVLKLSPGAGYVHVFDSRSGERLPA